MNKSTTPNAVVGERGETNSDLSNTGGDSCELLPAHTHSYHWQEAVQADTVGAVLEHF